MNSLQLHMNFQASRPNTKGLASERWSSPALSEMKKELRSLINGREKAYRIKGNFRADQWRALDKLRTNLDSLEPGLSLKGCCVLIHNHRNEILRILPKDPRFNKLHLRWAEILQFAEDHLQTLNQL